SRGGGKGAVDTRGRLPAADLALLVQGDNLPAGISEGEADEGTVLVREFPDEGARLTVPQAYGGQPSGNRQQAPVGAVGQATALGLGHGHFHQQTSRFHVPDAQRSILAGAGEPAVVRGEGHAERAARVSGEDARLPGRAQVPKSDGPRRSLHALPDRILLA